MADTIYLVVPCYNEQEVLPQTAQKLKEKIQSLIDSNTISAQSKIMFVDDGSKDNTWQYIEKFKAQDDIFAGVKLSRNRGHQNAVLAGLMTAKNYADAAISLDADLQDDIDVIDSFIKEYKDGCDIVYGVRSDRECDTFFKRATAQCFYKVMSALGVETVYNHADYRLMSRRALECLSEYREVNLFLRGIVPLIGFKSTSVPYIRKERTAGVSKYPLKKMLAFALDGITSFSVRPIRFIAAIGATVTIISIIAFLYFLISDFIGYTVFIWTYILCSVWFLGGLGLLSLGIIGGYIGKIYIEVKDRPKYFIEKELK